MEFRSPPMLSGEHKSDPNQTCVKKLISYRFQLKVVIFLSQILLSPCHYPYCSIFSPYCLSAQAVKAAKVFDFDFNIELNSEETRRHKRVGVTCYRIYLTVLHVRSPL